MMKPVDLIVTSGDIANEAWHRHTKENWAERIEQMTYVSECLSWFPSYKLVAKDLAEKAIKALEATQK